MLILWLANAHHSRFVDAYVYVLLLHHWVNMPVQTSIQQRPQNMRCRLGLTSLTLQSRKAIGLLSHVM